MTWATRTTEDHFSQFLLSCYAQLQMGGFKMHLVIKRQTEGRKERDSAVYPLALSYFTLEHCFTSGFYCRRDWVAHTLPQPLLCVNTQPTHECI